MKKKKQRSSQWIQTLSIKMICYSVSRMTIKEDNFALKFSLTDKIVLRTWKNW